MAEKVGVRTLEQLTISAAEHMCFQHEEVPLCTLLMYKNMENMTLQEARTAAQEIVTAVNACQSVFLSAINNEDWGRGFIDTMEKDATPAHRLHYLVPVAEQLSCLALSALKIPHSAPEPVTPGVLRHTDDLEKQLMGLLDVTLANCRLGEMLTAGLEEDLVHQAAHLCGPLHPSKVCALLCAHLFILMHERALPGVAEHTPVQLIAPCVCMAYRCIQAVWLAARDDLFPRDAADLIHAAGAACALLISDMNFTRCTSGFDAAAIRRVFKAAVAAMAHTAGAMPSAMCGSCRGVPAMFRQICKDWLQSCAGEAVQPLCDAHDQILRIRLGEHP